MAYMSLEPSPALLPLKRTLEKVALMTKAAPRHPLLHSQASYAKMAVAKDGEPEWRGSASAHAVSALAWSPDNRLLLVGLSGRLALSEAHRL